MFLPLVGIFCPLWRLSCVALWHARFVVELSFAVFPGIVATAMSEMNCGCAWVWLMRLDLSDSTTCWVVC